MPAGNLDGRAGLADRATRPVASRPNDRVAAHDPRRTRVEDALSDLHQRGRRAVRIVDLNCGVGGFLLHVLHHARALGFVAVEGRGIDGAPSLIGRAKAAAARMADPGIGVVFEVAHVATALKEESGFPADILLWHESRDGERTLDIDDLLRRGGERVIGDRDAVGPRETRA